MMIWNHIIWYDTKIIEKIEIFLSEHMISESVKWILKFFSMIWNLLKFVWRFDSKKNSDGYSAIRCIKREHQILRLSLREPIGGAFWTYEKPGSRPLAVKYSRTLPNNFFTWLCGSSGDTPTIFSLFIISDHFRWFYANLHWLFNYGIGEPGCSGDFGEPKLHHN